MGKFTRLTGGALGALVLMGTAVGASGAHAASVYRINVCQFPDGQPAPVSGFTPVAVGNNSSATHSCAQGGSMTAQLSGDAHSGDDRGEWLFVAPDGTQLSSVTAASRVQRAAPGQAYGVPQADLSTDLGEQDVCNQAYGCTTTMSGSVYADITGARWVSFRGICKSSGAACPQTGLATTYSVRQVQIALVDAHAPAFSGAPSGTLMSASTLERNRSLSFSATDRGGGVMRQQLFVGGGVLVDQVVDENNGSCRPDRLSGAVPCRLSASGSLSFDTGRLADGPHQLKLRILDATDANRADYGPWEVMVDNQPPVVSPVEVSGVARAGDTLTGRTTINGQSPQVAYQWLRTRADGSGEVAIPGATGSTYVLTDADAGSKVVLRVSATDHGGTATQTSSVTSGPFADGALVRAYCDGRPTGPQDDCGDFDKDGQVNRVDTDDDGDGVIDANDAAPFDASIPVNDPCRGKPTGPTDPCGDFDKDGQINSADADKDGDGTPATSDPDDYDPAKPDRGFGPSRAPETAAPTATATSTAATPLGSTAIANPLDPAAVPVRNPQSGKSENGDPADLDALLSARFERGAGSTLRTTGRLVAGVREAVRVAGAVTTRAGRPISGARVYVAERVGNGPWTLAGSTESAADGSYAVVAPAGGRSREMRVVYFPRGGDNLNRASNPLALVVRQDALLGVSRSVLRNGQTLRFRGLVLGRVAGEGTQVQVQVKLPTGWYTFRRLSATRRAGGRFTTPYRFRRTTRTTRYRFRLKVLPRGGSGYATGYSRVVTVTVRGR